MIISELLNRRSWGFYTTMDELHEKNKKLQEYLKELGNAAVAFSAGVDSTFLLKTAHDVLGDKAAAFTVRSCSFPARELNEAKEFCEHEGINQVIVDFDEFSVEGFAENPIDRCYICKYALFTKIKKEAEKIGLSHIVEGSNTDDSGDYRPGLIAVSELGIKSPLRYAGLSKTDIRALSEEMGLPTWNKPSFACLATRFAYGDRITKEKLAMVEKAEQKLFELGFRQVRVRMHGDVARIETLRSDFSRIIEPKTADEINDYFKALGFNYVSLDLGGYKTGNMNLAINNKNAADS